MATFAALIERVRTGRAPLELVYASHPSWPHPRSRGAPGGVLRVAVLDSSFNPPSRAHLALVNVPRPAFAHEDASDGTDYDAKLLLLSVRNADKQLAPGDATHAQRLEMMLLCARSILHIPAASAAGRIVGAPSPQSHDNVAVAIIDEPTFVGKSTVLLSYLRHRLSAHPASLSAPAPLHLPPSSNPQTSVAHADSDTSITQDAPWTPTVPRPQLTFLVGTDTLERLFAPRYYASPDAMRDALHRFLSEHPHGDDARVVCALRALVSSSDNYVVNLKAAIAQFAVEGRVQFVDIPEELKMISSTSIRRGAKDGDASWKAMVVPQVAEYIVEHNLYLF
ncbi:Nucleotidylyl transferase [Fomitopsis betulina]|nr:Nucleotidylyl transferase [Fomitopsis betulina]